MDIFSNHRKLFGIATALFVILSIVVAILPAANNQNNNAPLPGVEPLTDDVLAGKHLFISNGCVACHSQQVRNIEMDKVWGTRPSIAADYSSNKRMSWWMNTATLMGTERTGPDLTNIGNRLPSTEWHLLHLYNPRAVVQESIMPAYPWLFEIKVNPDQRDKEVHLPETFTPQQRGHVIATKEALQLVAYLLTLKQTPLPEEKIVNTTFLGTSKESSLEPPGNSREALDGSALYESNCQACHQANGEGLQGAFPPLKGSKIVLDDNPEIFIDIIMNGYNPREEYAEMPAVGQTNELTPAQVTAIVNHERTSWGNQAREISLAEVEKIIAYIKTQKTDK